MRTLAQELEDLRPWHELWHQQTFVKWRAALTTELEELREAEWAIRFEPSARQVGLLKLVGLKAPEGREELLTIFCAFRSVVHYTRARLLELETRATRYEVLKKEQVRREHAGRRKNGRPERGRAGTDAR